MCTACQSNQKEEDVKKTTAVTKIVEGADGQKLDSILTPYLEKLRNLSDNNAGLAIGITKGDQIIYAHTFGYANIEANHKADFNTVFHIASVSKPFTAAAIVKLVQQGKLNLDDKLIAHIPDFKMKGEAYKDITIKHVLNHTSGIPRHVSANDWEHPKPLQANLQYVKNFELDFTPNTAFSYSNSAFDILGIVIENVSGVSFEDYITTHILQPAGMHQSTYIKPKDSLPATWAKPYSYGLQTQEWSPYPYAPNYYPSSGLQTTLLDMCTWGMLHAGKGTYNGKTIFDKNHFKLLTTPYYKTPWGDHIGLSWFLQSYLERPIIMHTGADTGFESIMYVYPNEEISIIVMANRDFSRTGRIINAASEVLFDSVPKNYNLSARYKFTEAYKKHGIDKAKETWERMQKDTTDIYFVNNDDILTTGAVLENGNYWKETQDILTYYLTLNKKSTYAWRLLGNAYLHQKDTLKAVECYEQTLAINPNYEKGKAALAALKNK
ncbi:CubicO group peptidase (beta-lactamase class C family) [Kordia periserrulae]|uniref:CubicO group peptidase (Beta-lactamase class C family) n=2 Tax=Kordia periserrulae TaxID=701523 RepID=A0A2T6C2R5_9FLAO|nr:CubicO group peptidase (beta-lactamase class C family) [Kordia periserrulae]